MKEFTLSKHAQEEINNRQILLAILEKIITQPEQILEENEIKIYQGRFTATNGKTYLLRVIVNENVNPVNIITVYRTSKIKKYWRL